jgi:hypothetical protein
MPTPNHHEPEDHKPDSQEREHPDASAGYEQSDVRVTGIVVFLTALAILVAVTGILAYGIGKVINAQLNKEDGPNNKWTKTVDVRQLGNLPSSPELQHKIAELTQNLPTPRLQTDDGMQDVTELHAREDLLLENYSWADRSQGKVRVPIERAMELIVQRGLPVAPTAEHAPLMVGDSTPVVGVPLTNGFARTGYEQEQAQSQAVEAGRQK